MIRLITQRNVDRINTGLLWEVKSSDNLSYRYFGHRYQWFSAIASTNGGSQGGRGSTLAACNSTLAACTTQEFIKAVQFNGLCGVFNWRMPLAREIMTIMHFGATPFWEAPIFPTLTRFLAISAAQGIGLELQLLSAWAERLQMMPISTTLLAMTNSLTCQSWR